jgi:phage terminase large subunit-like protein
MSPEEIDALDPIYIGPTWQREDDRWRLPAKTLGWEIIGWCGKWLKGEDGKPWQFTPEQMRFVLWWYAVDNNGRFVYRKGVLQRMKGWGKDPLLAVLCLVELVGPSRFSHWDENGEPVGKMCPRAWVQVTAVNQSQTTNTMEYIPSLMTDSFIQHFDIKAGAELIRAMGGTRRLEAVTSSYRAIEGKRTTFVLLNETHHWVEGNHGHKMYETIDGNATKRDSRYLAITNAYLPGEDSVAQKMRESFDKVREGRMVDVGSLYDSVEAHPATPLTEEALLIVIPKIRGDAVWLRPETIIQSIQDGDMSPSRSRRMWLNQIVAEEDALYSPQEWDPLEVHEALLQPGEAIVLGFDGGKTDDSTALVAIRVRDQVAFLLGLWEKPDTPDQRERNGSKIRTWVVPREEVDQAVTEAFKVYEVQAFYADVALWESNITDWSARFGDQLLVKADGRTAVGWDMRASQKKSTFAHERLMRSIIDKTLGHNGDPAMRRHVLNARRRTNNFGVSFGKESRESPRKVDIYAALMLAHEALHDLRTRGKKVRVHSRRGVFL